MKIRNSFVSNSSSSSFIAFVNKEAYNEMLSLIKNNDLKEYIKNKTFTDTSYNSYIKLTRDSLEEKSFITSGYYKLLDGLLDEIVILFQGGFEYGGDEDDSVLKTALGFIDDIDYNYLELI